MRTAQQMAIEEVRVVLHRGDHHLQHVVVGAAQALAFDDLRPLQHEILELLQGALRLQSDEGVGDHAETELAVVQQCDPPLDVAGFLEPADTPQAGCGRQMHPRSEVLVAYRGVALKLIEDAQVDGVEVFAHDWLRVRLIAHTQGTCIDCVKMCIHAIELLEQSSQAQK